MRNLKLTGLFLAFLVMLTPLRAAVTAYSAPVVDGAWTFIGVSGYQSVTTTSTTGGTTASTIWSSSQSTPVIIDDHGAGFTLNGVEVPTWDGNVSSPVTTASTSSGTLDTYPTPRAVSSGAGVGSNQYGTVGLMALGQDYNDTNGLSGLSTGSTIPFVSMNYTRLVKDYESPIRTMYVKSDSTLAYPDIKIFYMANYELDNFFISVENNTTGTKPSVYYQLTFNRNYTFTSPAVMTTPWDEGSGGGSQVTGNDVTSITDAFDDNLTDNNITGLNNIGRASTSGSLRAPLDGNLTVLTWDSLGQEWDVAIFDGNGSYDGLSGLSVNDFSNFEAGKGYWVRLERTGATDYTNVPGFVLGDDPAVDLTYTLYDGWNMLAFHDDYLAYSITGMYIAGHNDINITDTYGATTLSVAATATYAGDCVNINAAIDGNNTVGYTNMNIKCIPGAAAGAADAGIVLLSNRRFTVQSGAAAITDLLGVTIAAESNGTASNFYKSRFGAFTMVIEPNEDFQNGTGVDGNMSVKFPLGSTTPAYVPVDTVTSTELALEAATGMDAAANAGTINSVTVNNNVLSLDMDFDETANALLMASNFEFYVKDATLVRTFDYDPTYYDPNTSVLVQNQEYNTTAEILGKEGTSQTRFFRIVDENLSQTIANINALSVNTEVNATRLDADANASFMIFYTGMLQTHGNRIIDFDVQEWGTGYDLLTETQSDSNVTSKGAIARLWYVSDLLDVNPGANDGQYSAEFNASTHVADVKYTPYFAQSFPTEGALYDLTTTAGKNVESLITGQTQANTTSAGTFVSWKQIDTTKTPDTWYDTDDQYELFWTEKEKGYWVYINGDSTIDFTIDSSTFTGNNNYAHFANPKQTDTSTSAFTTRNHLNKVMTVVTTGQIASGATAANNEAFSLFADINGLRQYFEEDSRSGTSVTWTIPLSSHESNDAGNSGVTFDYGTMSIAVTAADGAGKSVSTTYSFDYEKPVMTGATIQSDGVTYDVAVTGATTVEVYAGGDINDSLYGEGINSGESNGTNYVYSLTAEADGTTSINMGSISGLTFPSGTVTTGTAYTAYDTLAEQLSLGMLYDVRFVARDSDSGIATALYSDQLKRVYAALYSSASILYSADNSAGVYDNAPNVHDAAGVIDTTWSGDDGVQLKAITGGAAYAVTLSYGHKSAQLDNGVPTTKIIQIAGGTDIAEVVFAGEYDNTIFYIYDANTAKVYVGYFDTTAGSQYIDVAELQGVTGLTIIDQ